MSTIGGPPRPESIEHNGMRCEHVSSIMSNSELVPLGIFANLLPESRAGRVRYWCPRRQMFLEKLYHLCSCPSCKVYIPPILRLFCIHCKRQVHGHHNGTEFECCYCGAEYRPLLQDQSWPVFSHSHEGTAQCNSKPVYSSEAARSSDAQLSHRGQ